MCARSSPSLKRRASRVQTLPPPPTANPADTAVPELEAIRTRFPEGSVERQDGLDQPTWIVRRDVKQNPATQFDMLLDLCGVDFPDRVERFEAIYHLYSVQRGARLRLKVP